MRADPEAAIATLEAMSDLNPLVRQPIRSIPDTMGPLAGTPVVVKANIAISGLPHCGASPALSDNVATRSAPAVVRLQEAGAVIVGQANMHELAFGITSRNSHHGPVGNPANPAHIAGGSSGGTAAAVAGGAVPMGLASDTGGSGRLPAAMCGCVGLRPTHGRYPGEGVLTLSSSFDTISAMARNVGGIRVLDAVLAGVEMSDPTPKQSIRLGIVEDAFWRGVDAPMVQSCRDLIDRLAAQGVEFVPLSAPDLMDLCDEISLGIVLYETKAFWDAFLEDRGLTLPAFIDKIASPDVAGVFQMIADGAAPDQVSYQDMVGPKRTAIKAMLTGLLSEVDGLVYPTLAMTAPPIDRTETCLINGQEVDLFTAMTRRALVASITGHPSISLPLGQLDGLPIGLEILGKHGQDLALLDIAAHLEQLQRSGFLLNHPATQSACEP